MVGCPRSGTTLAQSLLASAPGMVTFTESHFFDKCFSSTYNPFRQSRYDRKCVKATIERFDQENGLQDYRLDDDVWRSAHTLAHSFVEKLDEISAAQSGIGWIEKTPDHLRRIRLIRSVAPDVTFVHVLRNPTETITSLRKASKEWGKPRSWLAIVVKWSISVVTSATYMRKPGHVHVFYEDVIHDSRKESKRLFDELGLVWDEGVLERYLLTAQTAIAADESWKQNNFREIGRQTNHRIVHNWFQKALLNILESLYRKIKANAPQRH